MCVLRFSSTPCLSDALHIIQHHPNISISIHNDRDSSGWSMTCNDYRKVIAGSYSNDQFFHPTVGPSFRPFINSPASPTSKPSVHNVEESNLQSNHACGHQFVHLCFCLPTCPLAGPWGPWLIHRHSPPIYPVSPVQDQSFTLYFVHLLELLLLSSSRRYSQLLLAKLTIYSLQD